MVGGMVSVQRTVGCVYERVYVLQRVSFYSIELENRSWSWFDQELPLVRSRRRFRCVYTGSTHLGPRAPHRQDMFCVMRFAWGARALLKQVVLYPRRSHRASVSLG